MSDKQNDSDYSQLFKDELLKTEFFMIRHETEFFPSAGITAVTKQERRNFTGGMILAPYFPEMEEKKVKAGKQKSPIFPTGIQITAGKYKGEIWITADKPLPKDKTLIPIVYLYVDGYFTSDTDPYYSGKPNNNDLLKQDALVFGLAVKGFFDLIYGMGIRFNGKFINGADWESVPALFLVKDMLKTSITLHNIYDHCLKDYVDNMDEFKHTPLNSDLTVLQIALDELNVATCVNRIFEWGMLHEPFHTEVMAKHLHSRLGKVIGIDNGRFRNLSDKEQEILKALQQDLVREEKQGEKKLFEYKNGFEDKLIIEVEKADEKRIPKRTITLKNKAVFVFSGRLVPQKLHDVSVAAVRKFLQTEGNKEKAVFFFPVMPGPNDGNRQRLLRELEEEFPENVVYNYAEKCPFYGELQIRADFNVLPSLYEPHGSAYDGFGIPLVNLLDGLLGQVHDPYAIGEAAKRTRMFHPTHEKASGLGFYASPPNNTSKSLHDLYEELNKEDGLSQYTVNEIFRAMVDALRVAFDRAVKLHNDKTRFAEMTCTALEKQAVGGDWSVNLERLKYVHT